MVSIYLRSALIATLLASSHLLAADLSSNEIDALLAKIPPNSGRTVDFREEKSLRLLKEPVISEGKLSFQPPDQFRREVQKPTPSISVSNGKTLWLYYPEFKEVEKYDLGKSNPVSRMIEAITASFDIGKLRTLFDIQGTQNANGITLHLTPKNSALRKNVQELTLALSPSLRLNRSILVTKDGSRSVTTYQNEKSTTLDLDTFEFVPPSGANVIEPLGK